MSCSSDLHSDRVDWPDHHSNGGTGVTKIPGDRLSLYLAAVAEYASPDVWITGSELHTSVTDLSSFWAMFRRLEQEARKEQTPP